MMNPKEGSVKYQKIDYKVKWMVSKTAIEAETRNKKSESSTATRPNGRLLSDHFSMDEAGFLNLKHIDGTNDGHERPENGQGPPGGGPPGGGGGSPKDSSWKTPWDTSQDGINSLVCNIMRSRDDHVPAACDYKYLGDTSNPIHTSWGIASTGTLLFNGLSGEGVDPFYPAAYNG